MKKRADGRYAKQVYVGMIDGKRKYHTIYATTQKELSLKTAAYLINVGKGFDPSQSKVTVRDIVQTYLLAKQSSAISEAQKIKLRGLSKKLEPLYDREAKSVKRAEIQALMIRQAEEGLCHSTLQAMLAFFRAVFASAMPDVLTYNPCDGVMCPAGTPCKQRKALTEEQQQWVRETPHRAQRAAMVMMYAGLRRGELVALTWDDVDLDAGTIRVNKSFDFKAGELKLPKTIAGIRTIYIPKILVDFLRGEKDDIPYVVHNAHGERMSPSGWRSLWSSYMTALNAKYAFDGANVFAVNGKLPIVIDTFTAHDLRHTFCTMLHHAGVDVRTAQQQMGHSSINVTLGIYTHLDKGSVKPAMSALDAYIDASQMQVRSSEKERHNG